MEEYILEKNMKIVATVLTIILAFSSILMVFEPATAAPKANAGLLDPKTIPKYTNQLTGAPPVYTPEYSTATADYYTVDVTAFQQQVLPTIDAKGNPTGFGTTDVWGYGGQTTAGYIANAPGPSFEATRDRDIYVRYQNKLTGVSHMFAVDPTLHWANPTNIPMMIATTQALNGLAPIYPPGYNGVPQVTAQGTLNPDGWNAQAPVPIIPHLHGGEVQSTSDGFPDSWFTPNGLQGAGYNTELTNWVNPNTGVFDVPVQNNEAVFNYPNSQPATTLWYHDHALGITRLNVMSGLAGFYLLRDTADTTARAAYIPPVQYEMPIVIQDRTFTSTGQFFYPSAGINLEHPYWIPEFFGDTIMVNGLVWPNMNVDQGAYRLRLLDGSNARFYTMSFDNKMPFTVIGSDGGYLPAPVTVKELTMGPGERYDVIVDFSNVPAGTKLIMKNTAEAPYKGGGGGTPANPQTVGQIMQFTVTANAGWTPTAPIPTALNTIPTLPTSTTTRQLTLMEVMGAGGPPRSSFRRQKMGCRHIRNTHPKQHRNMGNR